jgi:hypothetical protein
MLLMRGDAAEGQEADAADDETSPRALLLLSDAFDSSSDNPAEQWSRLHVCAA